MSMSRTRKLLHVAMFTPASNGVWGLPIFWTSGPGAAKSSVIRQAAEAAGLPCEIIRVGERGEGAFGQVPVPQTRKMGKTEVYELTYPRPEWVAKFDGDGAGLVFVDELTTAPPALQPPLLGLILDRAIGGYQLPPRVRTMAAGNPVDQAAGGYDLSMPLSNRLGHLAWPDPTADEWGNYLMNLSVDGGAGSLDPAVEERRVLGAWPDAWAGAVGLFSGFMGARPEMLRQQPKSEDPKASKAWPSPRTWEYAARAFATSKVHGLDVALQDDLIAAFIGEGAATELSAYREAADLPNIADFLDGKVGWKHDPKRLDKTGAVIKAACALLAPQSKDEQRVARAKFFWGQLGGLITAGVSDLVVSAATALQSADLRYPCGKVADEVMGAALSTARAGRL